MSSNKSMSLKLHRNNEPTINTKGKTGKNSKFLDYYIRNFTFFYAFDC